MAKKLKKAQGGGSLDQKIAATRQAYTPTGMQYYRSGKDKQVTSPTGLVTNVRRSGMVKSFVDPSTGESQVYRPRIVGSPHALKKETNAQGVTTRYDRRGTPTIMNKKGGAIKKYQAGGSTPRMSPSSVAKGPSKKTGSMHEAIHKAQETVKKAGVPKAPAPGMKTPPKKGGSTFRYQVGGSTMTPKSKSLDPIKNTPPVGSNGFKTGVYKGTKLTPAQIKQSQQDWIKKEKQMTNPKNKPAGSPMRKLQKGGSIKRK